MTEITRDFFGLGTHVTFDISNIIILLHQDHIRPMTPIPHTTYDINATSDL